MKVFKIISHIILWYRMNKYISTSSYGFESKPFNQILYEILKKKYLSDPSHRPKNAVWKIIFDFYIYNL